MGKYSHKCRTKKSDEKAFKKFWDDLNPAERQSISKFARRYKRGRR